MQEKTIEELTENTSKNLYEETALTKEWCDKIVKENFAELLDLLSNVIDDNIELYKDNKPDYYSDWLRLLRLISLSYKCAE